MLLREIESDYPYRVPVPLDNLYGMHLYSRHLYQILKLNLFSVMKFYSYNCDFTIWYASSTIVCILSHLVQLRRRIQLYAMLNF